ncbi:unnamed protein product [Closterium sp. Naga37s-1]|nr:unnamed protein product [Closterium sp. Naga37s-1]
MTKLRCSSTTDLQTHASLALSPASLLPASFSSEHFSASLYLRTCFSYRDFRPTALRGGEEWGLLMGLAFGVEDGGAGSALHLLRLPLVVYAPAPPIVCHEWPADSDTTVGMHCPHPRTVPSSPLSHLPRPSPRLNTNFSPASHQLRTCFSHTEFCPTNCALRQHCLPHLSHKPLCVTLPPSPLRATTSLVPASPAPTSAPRALPHPWHPCLPLTQAEAAEVAELREWLQEKLGGGLLGVPWRFLRTDEQKEKEVRLEGVRGCGLGCMMLVCHS